MVILCFIIIVQYAAGNLNQKIQILQNVSVKKMQNYKLDLCQFEFIKCMAKGCPKLVSTEHSNKQMIFCKKHSRYMAKANCWRKKNE